MIWLVKWLAIFALFIACRATSDSFVMGWIGGVTGMFVCDLLDRLMEKRA